MLEITSNTRVNCVTHNDMDGVFSGLVVRHKYPQTIVYQTNYGRGIESYWFDCDVLFVTDFSFDSLATLQDIETNKNCKLVWIDHHVIVEEAEKAKFNPEGLRRQDVSAARLCWEYLFPNTEVPTVIQYISDYDIWHWANNINALYFQNAIRSIPIGINQKSGTEFFNALLTKSNLLERLVANGKKIEDFNDLKRKLVCDSGGFYTKLNGIDALACNIKTTNSTIFKFEDEQLKKEKVKVPLRILFAYFSSINAYRVSVFSQDPEKYSCHEICKQYGGGGHDGAGGFTVKNFQSLPFTTPKPADKPEPFEDIFGPMKAMMDRDPMIENGVKSGNSSIVYGYSFGAVVNGFTACCINDPTGHVSMFYSTSKDSLYQLGIFYHLTKTGWWQYRIHVLDSTLDPKQVYNAFKTCGHVIDTGCYLVTVHQQPPIPVGGINGSN